MKKLISILILMITLLSVFENIVLGATSLNNVEIVKREAFETDVQFYEDNIWYTIEANYVCGVSEKGEFPAYCISHRKRWSRRSRELSSRY